MPSSRRSIATLLAALLLPVSVHAHKFDGVPIVAHRGAGFEVDENTLEACRHSYEKGFRGFEIDLRLTKDGHLVLMHDDTLDRTTGQPGSVEQKTLAELEPLRTVKDKCPIPTAEKLFAYFKDKPDVFIELEMKTSKHDVYPDALVREYCAKLMKTAKDILPPGTYVFTSFDRRTLAIMKELDPAAPKSLISGKPATPKLIEEAVELGCKRVAIVMEHATRKWVRDAQKAGLKVAGWPTRSIADAKLAAALGVDTLTTDIPSQLVAPASAK